MDSVFLNNKLVQITAIMTSTSTIDKQTVVVNCSTSEQNTILQISFININIAKKEYRVGLQKSKKSKRRQILVKYVKNGITYQNSGNTDAKQREQEPNLPGIITVTDYSKGKELAGKINFLLFSKADPKKLVHISGYFNAFYISAN